jgi:hypothetical protein
MNDLNEANFWKQVEKSSKEVHNRIYNNEDMDQPGSAASEEFIHLLNKGIDFSNSISHDFILSKFFFTIIIIIYYYCLFIIISLAQL